MLKLIVFDYDGVIVDSFPAVHKAYLKVCDEMGLSCPRDFEEFRKVYGRHSGEFKRNIGVKEEQRDEFERLFYEEMRHGPLQVFTGIAETLAELKKRYMLVLLSTNYQEKVEAKLNAAGLQDFFAEVIGGRRGFISHKGTVIIDIMDKYHVSPHETLLIGDRDVDYEAAQQAGTRVILVSYGWERIHQPVQHTPVANPKEIIRAIEEIETSNF
jgi:phosphoglycolate phosphatase-like HAD superfamily hydrolase